MSIRGIKAAILSGWVCSLSLAVIAATSGWSWPVTALYVAEAVWLGVLPLVVHRWWDRYSRCLSNQARFNRANAERLGEEVRHLKVNQPHDCREHLDNLGGPVAPYECLVCYRRYSPSDLNGDNNADAEPCGLPGAHEVPLS